MFFVDIRYVERQPHQVTLQMVIFVVGVRIENIVAAIWSTDRNILETLCILGISKNVVSMLSF